jgi:Rrf2 family protein
MRLEITRRAELAVRAMVVLGGTQVRLKGPALAHQLATTPAFVVQVVGPLVKAGWVRSDPGPTGGYLGCVGLDEVSVLEVIEAVDGATDVGRCVVGDRPCDSHLPCVLHAAWTRARRELMDVLGETPLADVAGHAAMSAAS